MKIMDFYLKLKSEHEKRFETEKIKLDQCVLQVLYDCFPDVDFEDNIEFTTVLGEIIIHGHRFTFSLYDKKVLTIHNYEKGNPIVDFAAKYSADYNNSNFLTLFNHIYENEKV